MTIADRQIFRRHYLFTFLFIHTKSHACFSKSDYSGHETVGLYLGVFFTFSTTTLEATRVWLQGGLPFFNYANHWLMVLSWVNQCRKFLMTLPPPPLDSDRVWKSFFFTHSSLLQKEKCLFADGSLTLVVLQDGWWFAPKLLRCFLQLSNSTTHRSLYHCLLCQLRQEGRELRRGPWPCFGPLLFRKERFVKTEGRRTDTID